MFAIALACRHQHWRNLFRSAVGRGCSDVTAIGVLQMHLNLVSAVQCDWSYFSEKYHTVYEVTAHWIRNF